MDIEEIRLTRDERHTLEKHWKRTEFLGMAIHDATNQATDKANRWWLNKLESLNQGAWSDASDHRDSWFIHPDDIEALKKLLEVKP